ncbi:uncharacterized protein Z518_09011 [Rhinocladiella mackenziei CBS 650.93]|uniref:Ubiquinol-cytochrome c chaperone domain-containing protein n=1 Tax=Rhinocladiella mackenziei CBS 650.93 TaxID=1442369 RepID=A0A0D2IDH4_9EURO|nr:uncharacterized protein Z518_09011 [Rhinocladiella mackenziei CBS 650.93]KIX01286.1 hypothetical protein Z518_09011 [Rhinocladiella mackenziei CBS 650.93]
MTWQDGLVQRVLVLSTNASAGSKGKKNFQASTSRQRHLSTASAKWQQAAPQKPAEQASLQTNVPPTTAGTVTSNITATYPDDVESPSEPAKSKSTARPTIPGNLKLSQEDRHQSNANITDTHRPSKEQGVTYTLGERFAMGFQKVAPNASKTYLNYGISDRLFKSCAAQADYKITEDKRLNPVTGMAPPKTADGADLGVRAEDTWWFTVLDLPPTFATWAQVTFLHMWILTVRLRALEPKDFDDYSRFFFEHFSYGAEDRMVVHHNISSKAIRNKYLRDMFMQWRGVLVSYDEGLTKGDAMMAAAVWRNVFRGENDVDWGKVALVVGFLRKGVSKMGTLEPITIMNNLDGPTGLWALSRADLQLILDRKTKGLKEPFTEQST